MEIIALGMIDTVFSWCLARKQAFKDVPETSLFTREIPCWSRLEAEVSKVRPNCSTPVDYSVQTSELHLCLSVSDLARLSLQLPPSPQLTVAVAHLNQEAERTLWIWSALLLPLSADSAVLQPLPLCRTWFVLDLASSCEPSPPTRR